MADIDNRSKRDKITVNIWDNIHPNSQMSDYVELLRTRYTYWLNLPHQNASPSSIIGPKLEHFSNGLWVMSRESIPSLPNYLGSVNDVRNHLENVEHNPEAPMFTLETHPLFKEWESFFASQPRTRWPWFLEFKNKARLEKHTANSVSNDSTATIPPNKLLASISLFDGTAVGFLKPARASVNEGLKRSLGLIEAWWRWEHDVYRNSHRAISKDEDIFIYADK